MSNELTGENLGSELNLCSENPGRMVLVVMPDMESAGELYLDLKQKVSEKNREIRFSARSLLFKNGSYIRIVTKNDDTDRIIENERYNCVLFDRSLIDFDEFDTVIEPDKADLDNFLKAIFLK